MSSHLGRFVLLFVVLVLAALCATTMIKSQQSVATGHWVLLPVDHAGHSCDAASNRIIVVGLNANGSVQINMEVLENPHELSGFIHEIMATRAEKSLFLKAAPELPYSDVVSRIGELQATTPGLHITLITPNSTKEPCGVGMPIRIVPFKVSTEPLRVPPPPA